MAMRGAFASLLRLTRNSPPFSISSSFSSSSALKVFFFADSKEFFSGFSQNQRFCVGPKLKNYHWRLVTAALFSGQAAILLASDSGFVLAQDDESRGKMVNEKNEQNYTLATELKRIEDGSVVSNEHTIKWRVFTDNGRDLFLKGKSDEAENLFKSALLEAKEGFGQRDPHVASSCNNLAELYRVRKEFDKAEPLYLEAISILEDSFGADDIRVGAALHNLGQFYLGQHKLDQARTCYERSLKIKGRVMGRGNPDYSNTMYHLGRVIYLQGNEKDAEELIRESISILEEIGLGESSTCLRMMRNLSQNLLKSNRLEDAESLQRKILHALELSQGWDSLETVLSAETLALTLQSLGNLKESQELLERCLAARKTILPEDHVQIAANLLHLARLTLFDTKLGTTDNLNSTKVLLDDSIRITKFILRTEQKSYRSERDRHVALVIFLQALDSIGLLETKKLERISPEEKLEYPYEAELALQECILLYKEPQIRSILLNAPDAKSQFLTSLNRLSIILRDCSVTSNRKRVVNDLLDESERIKANFQPKEHRK